MTSDGTARAGSDYTGVTTKQTVSWTGSEGTQSNPKTASVTILDDNVGEDDETFTITLSDQSPTSIVTTNDVGVCHGTITIRDNDPPAVNNAAANGTALTITFSKSLAAAANLANGAFTVKKTPQGGTEETVMLSGSPSISGTTVALTLESAVLSSDTEVKVSYTKPTTGSNNKLQDSSGNEVASFSNQPVSNAQLPSRPRPTQHPTVIESPKGVRVGALTDDGYPITLDEEEGSFLYRKKTIDITVTRDEECTSNPAVIIPINILDRVLNPGDQEIAFDLSETSSQDPPSGFRMEGCTLEIDPGVRLRTTETVTVCLPPADIEGKSYIHRYNDEAEQWELLPSQLQTVNDDELLCAETDTFSPFRVSVPVIESAEGVRVGDLTDDGFPITPLGEGGSMVYGQGTIDLSVTRDQCTSPGNPALIMSRSILDRVEEITFELSETSPQDPPSGFRLEGCAVEIDPGVTLGEGETAVVCLPPAEIEGKSYVHRYDETEGEWESLPSQLETVNGDELLCGNTDTFSLFGVFLPVIESAEGVTHSEDEEGVFSLTPLGEGGSMVYGKRTIDLSVTRDVDPSSGDPAIIVSRNILDRVEEITFELSEVSPYDPPPGFYLSGFAVGVDLGVALGQGETVSVCLPSSGGEEDMYYRYNEELGEWEVLESQLETVNGEDVVCGDAGAVSLSGVFVEETGGCAIAAAGGEGIVRWQGAVLNLLFTISVLLLFPGMRKLGVYDGKTSG